MPESSSARATAWLQAVPVLLATGAAQANRTVGDGNVGCDICRHVSESYVLWGNQNVSFLRNLFARQMLRKNTTSFLPFSPASFGENKSHPTH